MKLILKENVSSLGARGAIVNVARGYARNYLIPQGLAIEDTPNNLKTFEREKRKIDVKSAKDIETAQEIAARLKEISVKVFQKAGENNKLYGSVTTMDIAAKLNEQGVIIDRKKIILDEPIKVLGAYEIVVKLHSQVQATIKVQVLPEE